MPTKRHRKTALQVPEGVAAARKALALLGEVDRRLAALRDMRQRQLQAYTEALDAQLGADIAELDREKADFIQALEGFVLAHRGEVLGKRKSVTWPEGQIGYRSSKVAVHFAKADEPVRIGRVERFFAAPTAHDGSVDEEPER